MSEETPKEYWNPNVCPLCGNDEFIWGITLGDRRTFFRPEGALMGGGKPIEGRQCGRCGNIQLFAERPSNSGQKLKR